MMEDEKLDNFLQKLSIESFSASTGPEFRGEVWQRVGQLTEAREWRRRTALGFAIFFFGLGAGAGTVAPHANAEAFGYTLVDAVDYSPSALLL